MKLITDDDDPDYSRRTEARNALCLIMTSVEHVAITARCHHMTADRVDERITEVFGRVLEALGLPDDTDYPIGPWLDELQP